jgi:hypothetical protein
VHLVGFLIRILWYAWWKVEVKGRGREIKVGTNDCKNITTWTVLTAASVIEGYEHDVLRKVCIEAWQTAAAEMGIPTTFATYCICLSVCLCPVPILVMETKLIRDSPSSVVHCEWYTAVLQGSSLILYCHLCLSLSSGFFLSDSHYKASKQFFSMYATCSAHLILSIGWYSYLQNSTVTTFMIKWFSDDLLQFFYGLGSHIYITLRLKFLVKALLKFSGIFCTLLMTKS